MKFTLLFSLLFVIQQNFAQKQIDSISISDYNSECIEVIPEEYTIIKDSVDFIYKNGKHDLRVGFHYSTDSDYSLVVEKLFFYKKITVNCIYQIVTGGYKPKEDNPLFLYGIDDLSNVIIMNEGGKYRLIEFLIGIGSDNPVAIHLLLYNQNAKQSDVLVEFIENSQIICLKYSHLLI